MISDVKVRKIISEVVGRIIEEHRPEKIILFGSYAYGEPTEDSDLDILIVVQVAGNPVAVCLLPGPGDEGWIQSVATKMSSSPIKHLTVVESFAYD